MSTRDEFLKVAAEYVKLHPDNRTHDFVESDSKWYHITITPFTSPPIPAAPIAPSGLYGTTVLENVG